MNIYTDIGHFIRTAYQLNLQSMGRPDKQKAARDSQFVGKKEMPSNKSIPGAMGAFRKMQFLESNKGSSYNQANRIQEIIKAYITIIMEVSLMRRATEVTVT